MPFAFPVGTPSIGDTITYGGKTWIYDGYGWAKVSAIVSAGYGINYIADTPNTVIVIRPISYTKDP